MSVKSHSGSESSPEDNKLYVSVSPSFVRERDEKQGWRPYAGNSEFASAIFSQINNTSSDEDIHNQANFLYDYYGMTDETRQEPPSPGHSPVTSPEDVSDGDKDVNRGHRSRIVGETSSGIDIPIPIKENDSPVIEMRHSFPETGKTHIPAYVTQTSNESNFSKRLHLTSTVSLPNKEKVSQQNSYIPSSSDSENVQKISYPHFPRQMMYCNQKYRYTLEAQTSLVQKRGEDSLTYLNKGQFYFFTSEAFGPKANRVKSVIHLVFRNEKDANTELVHWKYWYNQQPNPNQRALDIDLKACQNIEEIEEVGYNALGFYWDPSNGSKVSLRINCLSTDFSAQKGVKGIPLHLQVDTFEDWGENADPVHRAFCQIKVFRDKGAERKNKDESKTVSKRMVKYLKGTDTSTDVSHVFQDANKVTVLYPTLTNLGTKSVVFVPTKVKERTKSTDSNSSAVSGGFLSQIREREHKRGFNMALSNAKDDLEHLDVLPRPKAPRVLQNKSPAVTIYVRKEEDKAYNALILENFTVEELKKSLSSKYNVPEAMIKDIYKKTKKGILVYMDNQLVEQFADEDDFLISITFDNQLGHCEVVFNC